MQKKNILHIAPTPFFSDRGCHIRIEGIVRCLNQLGFDNLVCTYHHGRDIKGVKTKRIGTIANYTKTSAGPSKYKLWADLKLLWLCFNQYRTLKPVAIHAHLHEGLLIGLIIKLLFFWRRTPIIADMQGSLTGELETYGTFKKYPFLKWPLRLLESILMFLANHIVCSSQHSLEKFKKDFSISEHKISLAQDGADLVKPLTAKQKQSLKKKLGLDENKKILIYSGALLDSKGLSELKQILLGLKDYSEELHALIIGYPTENLQGFLDKHNISQLCTLTGQVEFAKLPDYLSIADIAIDPKFSDAGEGSGKMLNYLACGLPIVAFDTQNNRHFLGEKALYASNIEEATEQLLAYNCITKLRQETSKQNLARFKKMFSWEKTKEQLEEVYKQFS